LLAIGVFALVAVIAVLATALMARVLPDYDGRLKAQADQFDLALSDLRTDLETGSGGKVVKASEFQVIDGEDHVLVVIGGNKDVGGFIATANREGKPLVALGALDGGQGVLSTFDGKGTKLVSLGATVGGEGSIATFNRAGEVKNQWP